jgi:hypothetical protein
MERIKKSVAAELQLVNAVQKWKYGNAGWHGQGPERGMCPGVQG